MRVLIADDHAIVRKGLIQLIREEFSDAEINEAANGVEVLEKVQKGIWDVILIDISNHKTLEQAFNYDKYAP